MFEQFFAIFPNFKALYLLSAKFRQLKTLSFIKLVSKQALEGFKTDKVLQVIYKNGLKNHVFTTL